MAKKDDILSRINYKISLGRTLGGIYRRKEIVEVLIPLLILIIHACN